MGQRQNDQYEWGECTNFSNGKIDSFAVRESYSCGKKGCPIVNWTALRSNALVYVFAGSIRGSGLSGLTGELVDFQIASFDGLLDGLSASPVAGE